MKYLKGCNFRLLKKAIDIYVGLIMEYVDISLIMTTSCKLVELDFHMKYLNYFT